MVAIRRVILRPRVSIRYKTFLAQSFDKDKWPPFSTSSVLSLAWTIPFGTALITEGVAGAPLNVRALLVSIVFFHKSFWNQNWHIPTFHDNPF